MNKYLCALLLAGVLDLAGCGGGGSAFMKPGVSDQQANADAKDCLELARQHNPNPGASGLATLFRARDECMQAQGYVKQ